MLTARAIAYDCLPYIGEANFALTGGDYSDMQVRILERIARDITASLQEIARARSDLFRQTFGFVALAPETQNVVVAQGSTALNISTAYTNNNAALEGASVNVGGQWNELRRDGASGFALVNPYLGSSGTAAMTVYGDCLVLPSTFARVIGFVRRDENILLSALPNRQALLDYGNAWGNDYGRRTMFPRTVPPRPGLVEAWWVEPYQTPTALTLRLHLTPLPDRAVPITFDAEVRPVAVTVADLGTDTTESTRTFSLPAGMDEDILLPLVLERWCRSPWFKNTEAKADLKEAAAAARTLLRSFQVQAQGGASMTMQGCG